MAPAGTSSSHGDYQGVQPLPGGMAYGIALLGDRMHTLIPANAPLPASAKQAGILATQQQFAIKTCGKRWRGKDAGSYSRTTQSMAS